jgi:hypothetical protein
MDDLQHVRLDFEAIYKEIDRHEVDERLYGFAMVSAAILLVGAGIVRSIQELNRQIGLRSYDG